MGGVRERGFGMGARTTATGTTLRFGFGFGFGAWGLGGLGAWSCFLRFPSIFWGGGSRNAPHVQVLQHRVEVEEPLRERDRRRDLGLVVAWYHPGRRHPRREQHPLLGPGDAGVPGRRAIRVDVEGRAWWGGQTAEITKRKTSPPKRHTASTQCGTSSLVGRSNSEDNARQAPQKPHRVNTMRNIELGGEVKQGPPLPTTTTTTHQKAHIVNIGKEGGRGEGVGERWGERVTCRELMSPSAKAAPCRWFMSIAGPREIHDYLCNL